MTDEPPRALVVKAPKRDRAIATGTPEGRVLDLRRVRRRRWLGLAGAIGAGVVGTILNGFWLGGFAALTSSLIPWVLERRRPALSALLDAKELVRRKQLAAAMSLLDQRERDTPELYDDGGVELNTLRIQIALAQGDRERALAYCEAALAAMPDSRARIALERARDLMQRELGPGSEV